MVRQTLSTTPSVAVRGDNRRRTVILSNVDTAITISWGFNSSLVVTPIFPRGQVVLNRLSGSDPTLGYFVVAASGTPVLDVSEEFDEQDLRAREPWQPIPARFL